MFQQTNQQPILTWWPTPQDYNEAIQITRGNLQDPELQQGLVYTDSHGLPRPITGSFASVYRLHCQNKDFALRLFLRNISDQRERYALISDFVRHDDLPYTVTFDFLKYGIKVMEQWLPALKMEWVDGPSLDDYIIENLANPAKLGHLSDKFVTMMEDLRCAGIAHGDLQHGNIIVWRDDLRLVDYDGMFVPAMHGFEANELGHCNYQHPERAAKHFGPYLDNFSAWVIYASVKGLQNDSRLLHQLGGGDDCLLFRQSDFLNPLQSPAFNAFEKHEDEELNVLGRFLRQQLNNDPSVVPALRLPVPSVEERQLEPLSPGVPLVRGGPRLIRDNLPAWLEPGSAMASGVGNHAAPSQQPWTVPVRSGATPNATPQSAAHQAGQVPSRSGLAAQRTKPAPVVSLPPELQIEPKRQVKLYYAGSGLSRPQLWQKMMILNPLVWFMFFYGFLSYGPDNALKTHGEDVSATIVSVEGQGSIYANVSYVYEVNGKTYTHEINVPDNYQLGQRTAVRVLSSNPDISENLGDSPGTKQSRDLESFLNCFFLNLILELIIWFPAWKHRKLAEFGTPALARVIDCVKSIGAFGQEHFHVWVLFELNNEVCKTEVAVSASEFAAIKRDAVEPILYDPKSDEAVLYRFCRYHPV